MTDKPRDRDNKIERIDMEKRKEEINKWFRSRGSDIRYITPVPTHSNSKHEDDLSHERLSRDLAKVDKLFLSGALLLLGLGSSIAGTIDFSLKAFDKPEDIGIVQHVTDTFKDNSIDDAAIIGGYGAAALALMKLRRKDR